MRPLPTARRATLLAPAVALGALVTGCGPSGGATSPDLGALSACALDSRGMTYVAGMAQTGTRGLYRVVLQSATPAPPQKDANTWVVEVRDAGGQPVDGATLVASPFMPDHGHGSPLKVGANPMGGGKYQLTPVYLHMAGMWRVTITVIPGGSSDGGTSDAGAQPSDQVAFWFCIEG